jgi:hypothetical protein
MLTKFKLNPAGLLIYLLIPATIIASFISCNKMDVKNPVSAKEGFALNDNSTIVMPDAAANVAEKQVAPVTSSAKYNTFYGPEQQMGKGHVRSWINISHDGKPLAIGIEMTDDALQGLTQDPSNFAASTFTLPLHQKAKSVTPFDHIVIDWNPQGHEPPQYQVPHFDFHFYKISLADQLAIPPYTPATAAPFDLDPPVGYMPPLYLHTPGGVPQMGAHWADLLSPEFKGQPFTYTFIYGSYNGHVIFDEPMITMAILQSGVTIHADFRQPQYFDPTNTYYPSRLNIWQDPSNGRHYVSLDHMIWRDQ